MTLTFHGMIQENNLILQLENGQGTLAILTADTFDFSNKTASVYLFFHDANLLAVSSSVEKNPVLPTSFTKVIVLTPPQTLSVTDLVHSFAFSQQQPKTAGTPDTAALIHYKETIWLILTHFGYSCRSEIQPPKTTGKARHRWSKAISQLPFFVANGSSSAVVIWQKRNELCIKAGARLVHVPPLNKDGSLGFSAKMGERIRYEHQDSIQEFVTTADIILKSVNEVGLFLHFGRTNSWLILKDAEGKSLNEWTLIP